MPTPPTEPELTEEEIRQIVAEELAKMNTPVESDQALTPQEIAQIALKSTVYLSVKTQEKTYYGSGFVVGERLIATCEHVLEGMASGTVESIFDNKKYPLAGVLAASEKHDLAIAEVKGFNAPVLPLGDSDRVQIGETIFVVGNPKKLKGTFSEGIVSGVRHERKGRLIQITAPTEVGSSGGPVLNSKGEVISVYSESEFGTENLNFSIAINHLKAMLATIR